MPDYPRGLLYAPQNPVARVLAVIVGLGLFALTLFLGLVFFAVFAALGALAWVALTVRQWWLTRGGRGAGKDDDIVDVEYRVVHREHRRR